MRNERRIGVRFPHHMLAVLLTGSVIAGMAASPQIVSAQIPDSKPKPGQGGVGKLHSQPYLVVSLPAGTPFQLSGGCVPGRPVLTFTVQVSNKGTLANRAQPPETVAARDETIFPERWQGQASLPVIPPGQSVSVSIPIAYVANMALSGAHVFRLYVPGDAGRDPNTKNPQAASSRVVFPDGYCAPPNSRPKPRPSPTPNKKPQPVLPGSHFSAILPGSRKTHGKELMAGNKWARAIAASVSKGWQWLLPALIFSVSVSAQQGMKACGLLTAAELSSAIGGSVGNASGTFLPKNSQRQGEAWSCTEKVGKRDVTIQYNTLLEPADGKKRTQELQEGSAKARYQTQVEYNELGDVHCWTLVLPVAPKDKLKAGTGCECDKGLDCAPKMRQCRVRHFSANGERRWQSRNGTHWSSGSERSGA